MAFPTRSGPSLGDAYDRRRNSFTPIRLILAALVLYAHCYAIAGVSYRDQLYRVTGGDMTFGRLAVLAFFVLSGFLVTQSLEATTGPFRVLSYLKKRALRVWPGLVVATLLVAFVVGALLTHRSLPDFYSFEGGWSPWWYAFDTLTYNAFSAVLGWHTRVRDLFAGNPMDATVNGSLWSLRFEVAAYLALALIAVVLRYRLRVMALVALAIAATLYIGLQAFEFRLPIPSFWVFGNYDTLIGVAIYFFLGVAVYAFRDAIPWSPSLAVALGFAAVVLSVTTLDALITPLAVTYGVLCLGTSKRLAWYESRFGDYSYGTYIYAWPVQQAVVLLIGVSNPYLLFAVALPVTLALAAGSWHFVEAPALRFKGARNRGPRPPTSSRSGAALAPVQTAHASERPQPGESATPG